MHLVRHVGEDPPAGRADRVAEADARSVDVEDIAAAVAVRPAPALEHREHLRGEGFVEFDETDIVPVVATPLEQALDCRHRADAHARRIAARRRPAAEPQHRREAQFLELVLGDHQTGRRRVVLLAGIACGDDGLRIALTVDRCERAERLHRGILAVAFVVIEDHRITLPLRDRYGHQLLGKLAFRPRGRCVLVRAHGKSIGLFARDAVILCEVFGGLDHAGDHPEPLDRLAHYPPAAEPVMQHHVAHPHTPARGKSVVLDIRHRFDAARHHDIGHPGLDHHRRSRHRLHARTAAAIKLEAGHFKRQSRCQPCPVADRGRLAIPIALREHNIINPRRINARALHQGLEDHSAQLSGVHAGKPAKELAHWGAERGADSGPARFGASGHFINSPFALSLSKGRTSLLTRARKKSGASTSSARTGEGYLSWSLNATVPASTSFPIAPDDSPSLSASTSSECSPRKGAGRGSPTSRPGRLAKLRVAG